MDWRWRLEWIMGFVRVLEILGDIHKSRSINWSPLMSLEKFEKILKEKILKFKYLKTVWKFSGKFEKLGKLELRSYIKKKLWWKILENSQKKPKFTPLKNPLQTHQKIPSNSNLINSSKSHISVSSKLHFNETIHHEICDNLTNR